MAIDDLSSNEAVCAELGRRLRSSRVAFPLTQAQLAERAGVSPRTIANLEQGGDVTVGSLVRVLRALGLLSRMDALVPKDEPRPTELAANKPKRQRVRPPKNPTTNTWKWGDEQ